MVLARRILKYGALVVIAALIVAWFVMLRPTFLGGPAVYITVTGRSMEPTLRSGDLVVLQGRDGYSVGDVVAYRIPQGHAGEGSRIVHRIVGGSGAAGYVTKGDNRASEDFWRPQDSDVLGEIWIHAPGVGRYFPVFRAPIVIATLAAGLAFWLVLDWGRRPSPSAG
jgi:signal peptidase